MKKFRIPFKFARSHKMSGSIISKIGRRPFNRASTITNFRNSNFQIRRYSPHKTGFIAQNSLSLLQERPKTAPLSNIQPIESTTSLSPILAVILISFLFFGLKSENELLEELAKALGVSIPEEKTPENLYLLKEKCLKSAYEKCRQGDWSFLQTHALCLKGLTDGDGHTLLASAILSKDVLIAEKLIELDLGKDKPDHEGNTPLHLAAMVGLVQVFPQLKTSIDSVNNRGETPLHLAIRIDEDKSVENLWALEASPVGFKGIPPIALAVAYEAKRSFSVLVTKENIQTKIKESSLLHYAIKKRSTGMLKPLLENGADLLIEEKDRKGRTPLALAAYVGDEEAIRCLFQRRASLDPSNQDSPLHWAIKGNHPNAFAYLFEASQTADKESLQSFALTCGHQPMADFIGKYFIGKKWAPKDQPPENLVIKGGGPKGTAFIGALEELEKNGALKNLQQLVGTSSGAIVSSLLAVGCTSKDIRKILEDNPVDTLLDPPKELQADMQKLLEDLPDIKKEIKRISDEGMSNNKFSIAKKSLRAYWYWHKEKKVLKGQWNRGGICSGDHFFDIINEALNQKIKQLTGKDHQWLTFGDLKNYIEMKKPNSEERRFPELKHLFIVATKIGQDPENITFSSLDSNCEDIVIASAVRASMSIPLVFEPTPIKKLSKGDLEDAKLGIFVDGGLLDNYPIDKLDKKQYKKGQIPEKDRDDPWANPYTWGLNLYSPEEKLPKEEESSEFKSVSEVMIDCLNLYTNAETILRKSKQKVESRTIDIDNQGVSLIDFTKDPVRDQKLIDSGKSAARNFLASAKLSQLGISGLYYNRIDIETKIREEKVNLPRLHPSFINRAILLEKIKEHFKTHKTYILVGLGGRGKSVLANAYAYANSDKYSLIFWINSETEESQELDYRSLAKTLHISTQEEGRQKEISLKDLKLKVFEALEKSNNPYLLILDNAETLPDFSPQKGSILITTQNSTEHPHLTIPPFTLDEACELLKKTTGEEESPAMLGLARDQLHLSPLLVRLAAGNIGSNSGTSISEYSKNIENKKNNLFNQTDNEYSKSLSSVYRATLKRLKDQNPLALQILQNSAYFSPDQIPVQLIDAYLKQTTKISSSSELEYKRDTILQMLEQYSLIEWQKDSNSFSVHRQTQEVIQQINNKETSPLDYSKMIDVINNYQPVLKYNPRNQGTLDRFQKLIPHCAALLKAPLIGETRPSVQLALTLARYYIESEGNFNQAEQCLKQIENRLPFKAMEGRVHFYRGMIHRKEGKHVEAQMDFKKAEECFEEDKDPDHYIRIEENEKKSTRDYQILISKTYFAQSLKDKELKDKDKTNQETVAKAYTLLKTCREEMTNLLGKDHFDVGRILREEADILFSLNRTEEAIETIQKSIEQQKAAYGENFEYKDSSASTFFRLGEFHSRMQDYEEAIKAYDKALEINKNMHRCTYKLKCYEKLAELYEASDNIPLAAIMKQKAAEISKQQKKIKKEKVL